MSVLSTPLREPMMPTMLQQGIVDRLLLLWPTVAVITGAVLLWIFGMALSIAITFGLLAGCVVAVIWVMATVPTERLHDGLQAYDATQNAAPRNERPRPAVSLSSEELLYMLAIYYK